MKVKHPVKSSPAEEFSVPSLERGMAIMELVGGQAGGLGLADIGVALGVSINSVFRIASALEALGYLRRDPETKKFFLAGKLLALGLKAAHARRNLVECSHDLLLALRDEIKESVAIATLLREEAMGVLLASEESLHSFSFQLRVGHRFELYCSAPGKAILARLSAVEYDLVVSRCAFTPHTRMTLTSREALDRDMASIRKNGYAIDREEGIPGCHCVGAAVTDERGYPVAAIWTSGPSDRMTRAMFPALGRTVVGYADRISRRLQGLE